ncbi:MAG TPA: DUF1565 domain-containing protein, partial [Bacteroidota bacterium]|nr:DUF1565 domain-containing protein [Bacteroidota bacterium]
MKQSWYSIICNKFLVCSIFIIQCAFAKDTSSHVPILQKITTGNVYFVSPSGSDTNPGTFAQPLLTISAAIAKAAAGDTIYVRGGTYSFTGSSTAITLPAKSGSSVTNRCNLIGYQGERALLDFSAMTGTSADGLKITGSFWYVKGFDCKGAPHNG